MENQRRIASEILGVGKNKVWFDKNKLDDIKKAITRMDIKELIKEGAIKVKIKKKIEKKREKRRRGIGSRKKKVMKRKGRYVRKIRKLRRYIEEIFAKKIINNEEKKKLRIMAKAGELKSLKHLKDYLTGVMAKELKND